MYIKLKYIIVSILLIKVGLAIFCYFKFYQELYLYEFHLPSILTGLIIVFFFLPRNLKIKNNLLTFSALGISILSFFIILNLTLTNFYHESIGRMLNEYRALNCLQMENRFYEDQKNNELKFFHFNSFYVDSLNVELKKYGITYYGMGSLYQENFNCYNKFVADYLKDNNGNTILIKFVN